MYTMRIFLSHPMAPEDEPIVRQLHRILESHFCEVRSGSSLQVGSLSGEIKSLIASCQVAVVVATARPKYQLQDGTFAIPPWIQQEMACAVTCQLPVIAILEKGVRTDDLKFLGDGKYTVFDRRDIAEMIISVSEAISRLQHPHVYEEPVLTTISTGRYVERWGPHVGRLLEAAMTCVSLRHYQEARSLLQQVIAANPQCWTAYLNMGVSLVEDGDADEAKDWYRKVIAAAPPAEFLARAYHNLGAAHELTDGNKDLDLVRMRLGLFRKALEVQPGRVNSMYSILLTYVALQDWTQAEATFHNALKVKGFVEHIQKFLPSERADMIRAIREHIDHRILEVVFPERQKEDSNE